MGKTMMNNGVRIQGEGFVLREWNPGDCASLAVNADNFNVWINLRDGFPHPYTAADAASFINMVAASHRGQYLAIEVGGRAVGGIGFTPGSDIERLNAEFGYWLGEAYWGRGIMTSAAKLFCRHIFDNTPIIRLWAGIYEYNAASQRVLQKAGFTHLTTLHKAAMKSGRVIDLEYYELVKPGI